MRRRPFKFFFAMTLGLMLFFFLARVVVFALFVAAIMSTIFFIGRKLVNFFKYMTWEDDYDYEYDYRRDYRYNHGYRLPKWKLDEEPFFDDWNRVRRERIIEVR